MSSEFLKAVADKMRLKRYAKREKIRTVIHLKHSAIKPEYRPSF